MPSWPNHNIRSLEYTKLANVHVVANRKSLRIRTIRKTESARKKEAACTSRYWSHHVRIQNLEDAIKADGVLKKHSVAKCRRVTSYVRHPCVKNGKIGLLGYRFMRRLAKSPPKPKSVPMTKELGSGTGAADEDRLATRKPMTWFSLLGLPPLPRVDDDRK